MNNTAMNIPCIGLGGHVHVFLLSTFLVVELLSNRVCVVSSQDDDKLFYSYQQ